MTVVNIQWNNCGAVLAVAGMQKATGQVGITQYTHNQTTIKRIIIISGIEKKP